MNNCEYICQFLDEHDIPYSCYSHKPIYTLEEGREIAKAAEIIPCKSLLLVNRRHQYYLLVAQGEDAVDLRSVASGINSPRLSFASPETIDTLLHAVPGAVSPLELIFDSTQQIAIIIDERLLLCPKIMMAASVNDRSIIMNTDDFINRFLPESHHPVFLTVKTSPEV